MIGVIIGLYGPVRRAISDYAAYQMAQKATDAVSKFAF